MRSTIIQRRRGKNMNSINQEHLFTVNNSINRNLLRSLTIHSLKLASKIEIDRSSRHAIIFEKKIIDPDSG